MDALTYSWPIGLTLSLNLNLLCVSDGVENDLQDRLRESERIREEQESRLRGNV